MVSPSNATVIANSNKALSTKGSLVSIVNTQSKQPWYKAAYANMSLALNVSMLASNQLTTTQALLVNRNCAQLANINGSVANF